MSGAAKTFSGDTILDSGILILNGNVRLPFGAGSIKSFIIDLRFLNERHGVIRTGARPFENKKLKGSKRHRIEPERF